MFKVNDLIKSRDSKLTGKLTGSVKRCALSGCRGMRYAVRWPDGKLTWPCSEGIKGDSKGLRIV